MNKEPISSHIFIFPFTWDVIKDKSCLNTSIDNRLNVEKFITELNYNKEWEEDKSISKILKNEELENDLDYNTYAYFYNNVRKAIYGNQEYIEKSQNISRMIKNTEYYAGKIFNKPVSNRIVRCFQYKNICESSIYEINILRRDNPYKLKIKSIKLKVYDTGVATLSYFLENHEYNNRQDILNINDYGRRIYPQYIPLDSVRKSFLAKKLSLKLKNGVIEEDFDYGVKEKPTKLSKTITNLLGENFISTEKELNEGCFKRKETIFIRPIIDDRMFVICYYSDSASSRVLTNFDKEEYLKNDFWYKFLFVDNGEATCQDKKMTKELLSKSTYTRWKDYGSLFGVSRYSFVLLCDESGFSKNVLYNHMNTIYYEMILLTLVQRASILRFSDETSRIANFENEDMYKPIKKLQEYYIRFVNTIYFREVTAQEQGIELYDKLMEFMRIDREVKRLDDEIDEIQRYISLETNEKTNKLLNLITFAGICISFLTLIATIKDISITNKKGLLEFQYVPLIVIIFMIVGFRKLANNEKILKIIIGIMTLGCLHIVVTHKLISKFIKFVMG